MAIFKSSNPALQEKTYQGTILEGISTGEEMTLNGTMNKFGVLMMLMIGSTLFAWSQFDKGSDPMPLMLIGVFGGLALAIVMMFKKQWATLHCTSLCNTGRTYLLVLFLPCIIMHIPDYQHRQLH